MRLMAILRSKAATGVSAALLHFADDCRAVTAGLADRPRVLLTVALKGGWVWAACNTKAELVSPARAQPVHRARGLVPCAAARQINYPSLSAPEAAAEHVEIMWRIR